MDVLGVDAYLNTRVSIFAKRLFSYEQIELLPKLEPSEIASRYGLGAFQEEHSRGLPATVWLKAAETALQKSLFDDLAILIRPMDDSAKKFIIQWTRKFELFNLKALIRGKLAGLSEEAIQNSLFDLPDYLSLPYQTLLSSESVLEMLRQLEKIGREDIAGQARSIYEKHGEPFLLETAIDQSYFTAMVELLKEIPFNDRVGVKQVLGLQMDRVNLVLMLRYRFAYQMPASEIYYHLASSPRHLTKERMLDLLNQTTLEEMLGRLPKPLSKQLEGSQDVAEVERRMYAITIRELFQVLKDNSSGVARSLAYLVLRELDLKRLFTVLQGQILKLDIAMINLALGIQASNVAI
jgi:V/A-type H+-transporting ATPase subunit C